MANTTRTDGCRMFRATVPTLVLTILLAAPAAAQVCVGLPPGLDRLSVGGGFEGRDGATGLGAAADLRAGRLLVSAEYRQLGRSLQQERSYSLQTALLSAGDPRMPICPLVRFDRLEQDLPGANFYPQQAEQRTAVGLGAAVGLPFETAYLKHIVHVAPRLDVYRWHLRFPDQPDSEPELRVAPGLTTGLTVRAPGLFYVRMTHTYARPRDAWSGYFTVRLGTWF